MDIESDKLEFKASMWSSYHGTSGELIDNQESKNLSLEDSVVKTIAGFLNTGGGTLLIGVKDKPRSALGTVAEVLGIEPDYRWLKKGKRDTEGYEHTLLEILKNAFSNKAAVQIYTIISFPVYEDSTLCRVDVQPVPRNGTHNVVYTKTKTMGADKFFTRSGDSTFSPSMETSITIINHRFNHPRDRDQS
jgi:predicted HTH transcriptional regulator